MQNTSAGLLLINHFCKYFHFIMKVTYRKHNLKKKEKRMILRYAQTLNEKT